MTKKPAKKRKSAKKAKGTVHVGQHRLLKIAKAADKLAKKADKADVAEGLRKVLGKPKETVFLKMSHSKFQKLKSFVAQHPSLAKHMDDCDCDENDPFCVCT
jgi:hypothetical protein